MTHTYIIHCFLRKMWAVSFMPSDKFSLIRKKLHREFITECDFIPGKSDLFEHLKLCLKWSLSNVHLLPEKSMLLKDVLRCIH